jgi:hypothetical protein
MLAPHPTRWQQTASDLLALALNAKHPRTRERFLALHYLTVHGGGATAYAASTQRDRITVMDWVHKYNQYGPEAMHYQHTGGVAPLFQRNALRT